MGIDEQKVAAEIVELHQFFEDWFTAKLPDTTEAFARFTDALAPDFRMILPSGKLVEMTALSTGLRASHGKQPSIRIWIENVDVRLTEGSLWLATYEEWQNVDGAPRGRLSTVLFSDEPAAPGGLRWRHVHETNL